MLSKENNMQWQYRRLCKLPGLYTQFEYCRMPLPSYLDVFSSVALYWLKQLFIIDILFVKNGRSFSFQRFRILLRNKNVIWTQGSGFKLWFFDSLNNNDTNFLLIFDNSCGEVCNSKFLLIFPPLKHVDDRVLVKSCPTCFINSNGGEMLTNPVIRCKSVHWKQLRLKLEPVDSYRDSNSIPSKTNWLNCCCLQPIDYIIDQTADPLNQNFLFPIDSRL